MLYADDSMLWTNNAKTEEEINRLNNIGNKFGLRMTKCKFNKLESSTVKISRCILISRISQNKLNEMIKQSPFYVLVKGLLRNKKEM